MAQIIREINVDVAQLNRFAAIVAKQYDKQSRFLKVNLLNNEQPIVVESNAVVTINARREDDKAKSFAGTVNGDGSVQVPLTYWMLELDGTVKCDISIIVGTEVMLTTTLFELEVQEAAVDDTAIQQDDDYGILVTLIKEVQEALTAESVRVQNENKRISSENSRVSAESSRKQAENIRVSNENERVSNEKQRVSNENNRVSIEGQRVDAEALRISAENNRKQAETVRVQTQEKAVQAVQNCADAVAAVQLVTQPFFITDTDNNKQYTASIQVQNGKPVLIYEELVIPQEV